MRALVWHGERDIQITDVDTPKIMPGEVLLRVLGAGICGSDVGRYQGRGSAQAPPIILGHEFVGEVVGTDDEALTPIGARVAVFPFITDGSCKSCLRGNENLCRSRTVIGVQRPGGFAEYVAVPAMNCYALHRAPEPAVGALIEPFACALRAARQGAIRPGDRLLVLGSGGIGLLVVAAASKLGLRDIVVSDRTAHRQAATIAAGAAIFVDASSATVADALAPLTDGDGFDVVVDAIGTAETRRLALDAVRAGGRVVLVGLHEDDLPPRGRRVIRDELTIVGSFAYGRDSFAESVALADHGLLDRILETCAIRSLADGPRAFEEIADGSLSVPRVILRT